MSKPDKPQKEKIESKSTFQISTLGDLRAMVKQLEPLSDDTDISQLFEYAIIDLVSDNHYGTRLVVRPGG